MDYQEISDGIYSSFKGAGSYDSVGPFLCSINKLTDSDDWVRFGSDSNLDTQPKEILFSMSGLGLTAITSIAHSIVFSIT